jgi:hypothetical protein
MNLSNPGLPDKKAANRAVAAKSAIVTKSVIVTNKAVAARSTSAINKAVVGKRVVAAKKAADNKLREEQPGRSVIMPWINERREATPAVFPAGDTAGANAITVDNTRQYQAGDFLTKSTVACRLRFKRA